MLPPAEIKPGTFTHLVTLDEENVLRQKKIAAIATTMRPNKTITITAMATATTSQL
jgi:hypothetical protein